MASHENLCLLVWGSLPLTAPSIFCCIQSIGVGICLGCVGRASLQLQPVSPLSGTSVWGLQWNPLTREMKVILVFTVYGGCAWWKERARVHLSVGNTLFIRLISCWRSACPAVQEPLLSTSSSVSSFCMVYILSQFCAYSSGIKFFSLQQEKSSII